MFGETRYLAYLLRLWVTDHGDVLICRAVLLDPHSGEQRAFAGLESLFAFIREEAEKGTRQKESNGGHAQ